MISYIKSHSQETEKGIIKGILLVVVAMFALTAVLDVDVSEYIRWQWWKDAFVSTYEWMLDFYNAHLAGATEWLIEKVKAFIDIIINTWRQFF